MSQAFYWNCVRKWYCAIGNNTLNNSGCVPGQYLNGTAILNECNAAPDCACVAPVSFVGSTLLPDFWKIINYTSLLVTWSVR